MCGIAGVYRRDGAAADRDVASAFHNGEWVLRTEKQVGALFEPAVQRVVDTSSVLVTLTSFTYWLSQFAVVGITLLWVYFRHHERFAGFRNWLIVANLAGLVGYVFMPTAPPRMFPEWGFVDTLGQYSSINHSSSLIAFASNPYAAMPSLHAMDALIVGIVMFGVVRSRFAKALWLAWPIWISPWVTEDLTDRFVPVHPLLAINGAMVQMGYWQQSRLMYHLTNLGQDVHAVPPDTAYASIVTHAVIGAIAFIPVVAWRLLSSRRAAAAAG